MAIQQTKKRNVAACQARLLNFPHDEIWRRDRFTFLIHFLFGRCLSNLTEIILALLIFVFFILQCFSILLYEDLDRAH